MADRVLSQRALNRALLARQLLLERQKLPVVKGVERTAGLHAQIPRAPFVGLWSRLAGFERQDLVEALHQKRIVRATTLRGTLHLFSAADFVVLRPVLQAMLSRWMMRDRNKGIDAAALAAFGRKAFQKPRTFEALRDDLAKQFPRGDIRALAYTIRLHVPLVMVPVDSPWCYPANADFVLADTWLRKKVPVSAADAAPLVKRYLAAFGPATIADAQNWSGFANLKDAFAAIRKDLVTYRNESGKELFDLPKAPLPDEDEPAPVRFVAELDNVLLGHADRTRVVSDEHRKRLMTKNLINQPAFLVDGVVAGAWKTGRKKAAATLVLEPYVKLDKKAKAAVLEEGERLVRFAEADAAAFDLKGC